MTSGGARARSGPPPDPDAIRRDRPADQAGWLTLPAKREGDPPAWPLTESTKREDALWARLWVTPQAVQWEALDLTDEVALYVRVFCEASQAEAKADVRTLVLRLREGLGLSMAGLARNRWRIASADAPAKETTHSDRRRPSAKDRLRLIQGEAAAS